MKFDWKKALGTTAILALSTFVTTLTRNSNDEFDNWLNSATDDELDKGYEIRRRKWAATGFGGNGEKTPEMKKINNEINRRSAEKWKNDPRRNTDPNFRWSDEARWDKD